MDGVFLSFTIGGMKSKRYHIIIGSMLFAVLMWISVTLGDEYQISIQIPLIVENVPEGKALKGHVPKTLTTTIRGTGWRLASLLLSGKPRCILNISALAGSNIIVTKRDLINTISVSSGIQPIDVSLDTLVFDLERYTERTVRILPNIVLECREGFGVVGEITVKPESIVVGGAESVVHSIQGWRTERRSFSDVRESFTTEIPLEDPTDYSFFLFRKTVQLTVHVAAFADKIFSGVMVEVVSVPPNREIIFIPPRVDIVVWGGIDQLAALSISDFRLSVDYQTLLTDTTGYVQPRIEFPSGIRILATRPERLQYIIRKRL